MAFVQSHLLTSRHLDSEVYYGCGFTKVKRLAGKSMFVHHDMMRLMQDAGKAVVCVVLRVDRGRMRPRWFVNTDRIVGYGFVHHATVNSHPGKDLRLTIAGSHCQNEVKSGLHKEFGRKTKIKNAASGTSGPVFTGIVDVSRAQTSAKRAQMVRMMAPR
jgi:hypothetical protein